MDISDKILHHVQPTNLNSKFDYENLNFPAYVSTVRTVLENVNQKLELGLSQEVIDLNAPFEWQPKQKPTKGVLLIHGLFDTPFIMRDIGKHFQNQGYLVRSILLPGHGTIPADLLITSPREWIKAVNYGVNSFSDDIDEVYLTGFSTGAALSLHYVLTHLQDEHRVKGLLMFCPAIAIHTKKSILLWLYRKIRWMSKTHKWIFKDNIDDYTKYTSFPVNSIYLVQRLIVENSILLRKHKVDIPVFLAMSDDDETVRSDAAMKFFNNTTNPKNVCYLYSNNQHSFKDKRIHILKSKKYDENILDLSHISVPIAPENSHYGRDGDYKEPIMEPKHAPLDKKIYRGAATADNEDKYRLQRITYNPFFKTLMQDMDQFLKSLN